MLEINKPYLRSAAEGLILEIRLMPNAQKDAIVGIYGDRIKISVTSRAIENKANQHLIKFLAKYFGLTQKQVKILRGETRREKTVLLLTADLNCAKLILKELNL